MDILSHGLWGGLLLGRTNKKDFWTAFAFGVAPDLFSFGIFTAMTVLGLVSGPDWSGGPPDPSAVPEYVHHLYNITHSLVTFVLAFGAVWVIRKKPYWPMLAWPLHILFDLPTHTAAFFPTPFLWPLLSYRFDGVTWATPWIFFPNWIALGIGYLWWFVHRKRISHAQIEKK